MSYILDALKKAERERGLAEVPTLETIHNLPPGPNSGMWTALGILVLCALAALWLFYPANKKDVHPSMPEAVTTKQSPAQSSITSLPAVVPSQPAQTIENPVLLLKGTAKKSDIAVSGTSSEEHLNNAKPDTDARVLSARQLEPAASNNLENNSQAKIPSRNVNAPSPAVQAKPLSLYDAVARMSMSIHLYSENKTERMVFINGKKYREEDSLEPGILLESITPEGAVLRSGEERAVLRPGSR
jgi:general secretion pathway protein B